MTDSGGTSPSYDVSAAPRCYRHPERETYINCQRCGRPICPDCMRSASVGFQCPECVKEGAATQRQARTAFGAPLGEGNVVTIGLIVLNVVFFLFALGSQTFADAMALTPGASFDPERQVVIEGVAARDAYWQLVTSTFLHTAPLHLFFNMLGLWIFGSYLESQLGRLRFLGLYLLCGLAGSVMVYAFASTNAYTLGASGSVFGMFGAALVLLIRQKRDVTQLLVLLAFNLAITFAIPNISWEAHLGGLATGLALGAVIAYAPRERRQALLLASEAVLLVASVVVVLVRTSQITSQLGL
jgi:membrane associated rhomboid family serine protease